MANETPRLEPALLTAAMMLEWRRNRGQLDAVEAPRSVLLTHQLSLFRALTPRFRSRAMRGIFPELRPLPRANGRVGIAGNIGVGGPATAMAVEELAAIGVSRIVAVDVAGSIEAALTSGSVVVATEAWCGDGTSPHYAFGESIVQPANRLAITVSDALTAAGIEATGVTVWSTDAPFRETASGVERWHAAGAALVDMETAALYASSAALGVEAAAILVVADELATGWQPPTDMAAIQATLRRIAAVVSGSLV